MIPRTCVVASTPGAGSWRLCRILGESGIVRPPAGFFEPLRVPRLSRRWLLPPGAGDWPAQYLSAARSAASKDGVCSLSLMWSHMRWLVRVARASPSHAGAFDSLSDAEVVSAWFPGCRYVHLTGSDLGHQALRWYSARHSAPNQSEGAPGLDGAPDFQEVRWLESLLERQERSWRTFFEGHPVEVAAVSYQDLRAKPTRTAAAIAGFLGVRWGRAATVEDVPEGRHEARADAWLEPYRAARGRLSTTVGIRAARRAG